MNKDAKQILAATLFFREIAPKLKGRAARDGNKHEILNMATNLRLKAARVILGLTQLQLAQKVGLKEIQISRLETGRSQATDDLKRRLSAVLQKPPFELFES